MSRLNDPENYEGRVRYAAKVIAGGLEAHRAFDNCFENDDGTAVAAALIRRAKRNEAIARNLPRYLNLEMATADFKSLEGKNLVEEARRMRAERQAKRARQDPPA